MRVNERSIRVVTSVTRRILIAGAVIMSSVLPGRVHAMSMLGVNFYDGENSGMQTLEPAEVAGAGDGASAGWYNNIDVATTCPTSVSLQDSGGAVTGASLSVKPNGTGMNGIIAAFHAPWNGTYNTDSTALTPTQQLFNGRLGTANSSDRVTEITVTGISYEQYDIYVYVLTTVYSSGSVQLFSGSTPGTTYYLAQGVAWTPGTHLPTSYALATATSTPSTYGANYVYYGGLSGTVQTIDVVGSTESGLTGSTIAVSGFQIVEIPEPGGLVLLAAGLLAVMRRGPRLG